MPAHGRLAPPSPTLRCGRLRAEGAPGATVDTVPRWYRADPDVAVRQPQFIGRAQEPDLTLTEPRSARVRTS